MYEAYWNLTSKPFLYRLPATDCHSTATQRAALLRLQYCVENGAGCSLLLGESGLGKTTVQRQLEAGSPLLRPFVYMAFPGLEVVEHLRLLCSLLSESSTAEDGAPDQLLQQITGSLQRWTSAGQHPVVCFDDAELISQDVMTDVILPLLNLRDVDDSISLTVILAGQPILLSSLSRQPQLRERVAVTATLSGMTAEEVSGWVQGRMQACGGSESIFSDGAVEALHRVSQGNPRRLNRLCDMALLVGCAEELSVIEAAQIEAVGTELLAAA